jgi:hypothetical protein
MPPSLEAASTLLLASATALPEGEFSTWVKYSEHEPVAFDGCTFEEEHAAANPKTAKTEKEARGMNPSITYGREVTPPLARS